MSIEALTWVWKQELPPNGKLVLLTIADHAHPDGGGAWPSMSTLARKTGYSDRQVRRIIDSLCQLGILEVILGGGGSPGKKYDSPPNLYRINMGPEPMTVTRSEFGELACPPKLRKEVIAHFERACYWCGGPGGAKNGPNSQPWHVDRLVPGSKGGKYAPDNVVLSCGPCNMRRKDRSADGLNRAWQGDLIGGGDMVSGSPGGDIGVRRGDDIGVSPGVTPMSGGGVTPVSPKSPYEPSTEPSGEPAAPPPVDHKAIARKITTAFWDKIKADTGKAPVGIKFIALVKLIEPFLDAGYEVAPVKAAVWSVYQERRPWMLAVIEQYLDGRSQPVRGSGGQSKQMDALRAAIAAEEGRHHEPE